MDARGERTSHLFKVVFVEEGGMGDRTYDEVWERKEKGNGGTRYLLR